MQNSPLIVLVHGALTDASIWNRVSTRLHSKGLATIAPALPLRSLQGDAEYLAAFLETLDGPLVLAGHSYGGTVISHPLMSRAALKSLVFVSAFVPDAGESTGALNGRWPGSKLNEQTTLVRPYPGGNDLYLKPERFAEVYASDLPTEQVRVLAEAQRPVDLKALGESFTGTPTWQTVPSFVLVSSNDASLPVEAQRAMATRAKATVVEVEASHASPLSQAQAVAQIIEAAAV